MTEQWGQSPQEQPQQPEPEPTQPQFPQYPQQQSYPTAPPLEGGYGAGYGGGYGAPGVPVGPPRNSKLAITSLILGILSLPLALIGIGPLVALVGLILGIVGIVGARRKNLKRALGITGIVLSLIGLIGGGLFLAAFANDASTCKALKNDSSQYSTCLRHNLKL